VASLEGLEPQVSVFEFRVSGLGFHRGVHVEAASLEDLEFRVSGLGSRISGFKFRVSGFTRACMWK